MTSSKVEFKMNQIKLSEIVANIDKSQQNSFLFLCTCIISCLLFIGAIFY